MTRQRPTFEPGSWARLTSFGAFATCESIHSPSLSVRGLSPVQKPPHSTVPVYVIPPRVAMRQVRRGAATTT